MGDGLGDRMKMYEKMEAGRRFLPLLPVVARLDGRSFSKFTQGLARPYDERFSNLMQYLTRKLVEETGACIGYTQSDEISLAWLSEDLRTQIFFDGKIHKMTSVLASMATYWFHQMLPKLVPEKVGRPAMFDCRVWQMPSKVEATNVFLWREFDASKNSIQSATRCYFSHRETLGKHTGMMNEMLFSKGINWNDYPAFFKRGSFFQKVKEVRRYTPEELERLPAKHEARANPDLEVVRTRVKRINMPPFSKVVNRVEVIFHGAEPLTEGDDK